MICSCRTLKDEIEPCNYHGVWMEKKIAAERERCAKVAESFKPECNCSATDIGVGILHEPTCGLPNQVEIAEAIRKGS